MWLWEHIILVARWLQDTIAECLRRWTLNPMGLLAAGSNPVVDSRLISLRYVGDHEDQIIRSWVIAKTIIKHMHRRRGNDTRIFTTLVIFKINEKKLYRFQKENAYISIMKLVKYFEQQKFESASVKIASDY